MKKLLGLGVVFLLMAALPACTMGAPTKEEIIERMENVDAYTYMLNMKIATPYGTSTIKAHEGLDKSKNVSFAEYEVISPGPTIKNTPIKTHSWEFFDGEYGYSKVVRTEDNVSTKESHRWDLNDLKYLLKDFLPANASREDVIQVITSQRDYISNILVPLFKNATIEGVEGKGGYYILRFALQRNGSISGYMEEMRKVENISGEMWVRDGLPTKIHVVHVSSFVEPSSNTTHTITKDYNVTFDYRFEIPEWAKKLREETSG